MISGMRQDKMSQFMLANASRLWAASARHANAGVMGLESHASELVSLSYELCLTHYITLGSLDWECKPACGLSDGH
jgi:hypothetical protein